MVRVALIGAGSMGVGIAWQIGRTPGMELAAVTDIDLDAARRAAEACGGPYAVVDENDAPPEAGTVLVTGTPFFVLDRASELGIDVMVEATNTIGFAARACEESIAAGVHVVLMNAEVDLALGPLLHDQAGRQGVVITSDAGDQHGVLMRMIDEIRMWAFQITMAGNIKGFLNRYATAESLRYEAEIRNLNPVQCCAYTDGTKLCVEMALVSNATGLTAWVPGMEGPRADSVHEVFDKFDFDRYGEQGVVDYVLGAEPGGGVFVVGHCDDAMQAEYLSYYKMGDGPYYLFYRPYHLCHLETTRAIALAALRGEAVLTPSCGRVSDVYAYAKKDLQPGDVVEHAIGGDEFYGMIDACKESDAEGRVPIALLETEGGEQPRLKASVPQDRPLNFDDIALPDTHVLRLFRRQQKLLGAG
jgi:predicted homoserine dehydrogenase-like protein